MRYDYDYDYDYNKTETSPNTSHFVSEKRKPKLSKEKGVFVHTHKIISAKPNTQPPSPLPLNTVT